MPDDENRPEKSSLVSENLNFRISTLDSDLRVPKAAHQQNSLTILDLFDHFSICQLANLNLSIVAASSLIRQRFGAVG